MCSIEQLFGWKGRAVAIALTVAPIVTGGYNVSSLPLRELFVLRD